MSHSPSDIDQALNQFVDSIEDAELRQLVDIRLKRNTHLVAGAILVDEAGKICLIQELKPSAYLKWNLPMGHWDHDETMPEAARREVKEESGYDIELTGLLPLENVRNNNVFRVVYIAKIIGGSPEERDQAEINAVEWFSFEEIKQKYENGELRDGCCWEDFEIYKTGRVLPLDTIIDLSTGNGHYDISGKR